MASPSGRILPIRIARASAGATWSWPRTKLAWSLRAQIGDCLAMALRCDVPLVSVKPHGALYGEVAQGGDACTTLLSAVGDLCEPGTAVVLPWGAPARQAATEAGVPVRDEGFCDRAYNADGTLMDRALPGAVYDDPGLAATQALALADRVDTLCLHGDSPGALAMAAAVRHALDQAGITVAAPVRNPEKVHSVWSRSVPVGEIRRLGDHALLVGVRDAVAARALTRALQASPAAAGQRVGGRTGHGHGVVRSRDRPRRAPPVAGGSAGRARRHRVGARPA